MTEDPQTAQNQQVQLYALLTSLRSVIAENVEERYAESAPADPLRDRVLQQLMRTEQMLMDSHQAAAPAPASAPVPHPAPPAVEEKPPERQPVSSPALHTTPPRQQTALVSAPPQTVRVNDAPAHQPEPTPAEPLPPGVEALSPGGWKTPLVLLPAGHGRPSSYYFLAEQWDPERPLYVLVPPGVNPDEVPIQNPTELLTHYLTTLRCLRRHGPYMLAGVCAGGLLSLEIARMLREREQTVAFVGLIETYRVPSMAYAFPRRTFMHVRKMMKMPPGMWPPYLRKLSKAFHYRLSVKLGGKPASPEPGRTALHQANNRICEQLRPKPWPGQIHYFLTRHAWAQLRKTPLVVWDDIALGGVERSFISGHHEDCLNAEYLPEWIDHFLALLDRADPACRPKIRQK